MARAKGNKGPRLVVRPLERTDWPAIEKLFGERGACGGCWCMAWRLAQKTWEAQKGEANRRALKKLVTSGRASGVLAFACGEPIAPGEPGFPGEPNTKSEPGFPGEPVGPGEAASAEPIGWCSVAPRADFAGLASRRALATDWDECTWSVTCFFIARDWRGRGVASKLLEEAIALAHARGASRIEGYPAPLPKSGEALPSAFAWTGVPKLFEQAGFERSRSTPGKRPIYVHGLARR